MAMKVLRRCVTAACFLMLLGCRSVRPVFVACPAASGKPWTREPSTDETAVIRFAIVGDRTGGCRPGVFEDAVAKLNLLHPDFVLSVGDYIEGRAPGDVLLDEWKEFDAIVAELKRPFFVLPGNHDISDGESLALWEQRYGRPYYHFVYRDVLFLCLNTEDPPQGRIGPRQVEYVREALAANRQARWTFVLMHEPLWLVEHETGFEAVEALLKDRNYTVIAGHHHKFKSTVRHARNYYKIATTGGASSPMIEDGQYDEIVWVTLTPEGPRLVNLLLSGILDDGLQGGGTTP